MSIVSVIIWVVVVLLILGVGLYFILKIVFGKKAVDKETQELLERMDDNPTRVISFVPKFTGNHAFLRLAKVEGLGLGGNYQFVMFPSDVHIVRDGWNVKGEEEFYKPVRYTTHPSLAFHVPRHSLSDAENAVFLLPQYADDLPEGLKPLFSAYLNGLEVLRQFQAQSQETIMSIEAGAQVLASSTAMGESFRLMVKSFNEGNSQPNVIGSKPLLLNKPKSGNGI